MIYTQSGKFFHKKKWNPDIGNKVDENGDHYYIIKYYVKYVRYGKTNITCSLWYEIAKNMCTYIHVFDANLK